MTLDRISTPAGRLIVVSNRLPFTVRRVGETWRTERSSGGLASALDPVLKRTGGLWLGWPGEAPGSPDEIRDEQIRGWRKKHGYVAVELPSELSLDWILLAVFETVRLVPATNFLLTLRSRFTRPE